MRTRAWAAGVGVGTLLTGCDTPPPPGDLVGRYRISGTMATDTCGPGLGATRAIAFTAELREDDEGVGYWLFGDREPAQGTIDSDGNFLFQQRGGWTLVNPVPERGYGGCRVAQVETIDGKVVIDDASEPDAGVPDLSGVNTVDVAPLAGDDCSPALASQGGPWLALPCRISYTLKGTRLDPVEATTDVDAGE